METIESDYSSDESTGNEEVLKSLAMNYSDTDNDSNDSDGNFDESLFANRCDLRKLKRSKTYNSENDERQHVQKKQIERLPTRRPNPKIYNRNALMARENRRKKKEYVESLECKIQAMNRKEKLFKKLVRKQNLKIKKLKHERSYLCGILANNTEVMSLVKTLEKNTNSIPITSSVLTYCIPATGDKQQKKQQQQSSIETLSKELLIKSYNNLKQEHSSSSLPSTADIIPEEIDFIDPAIYDSCKYTDMVSLDNWSALLSDDDPTILLGDKMKNGNNSNNVNNNNINNNNNNSNINNINNNNNNNLNKLINNNNNDKGNHIEENCSMDNLSSRNIKIEHNYFNDNNNNLSKKFDTGICLHVSGGKLSLEFCASCNLKSKLAWNE